MDTQTEVDVSTNGHGNPDEVSEDLALFELVVDGVGQLSMSVGGQKPDVASVKMKSKKIGVPKGDYKKGDLVKFEIEARCVEVAFIDKVDHQTQTVTETERRHTFAIVGLERKSDGSEN